MKIGQKLFLFLAITIGILFVGVGKVQAASHSLSPSSGLVGSQFTITRTNFTPNTLVFVQWDSDSLSTSSTQADGSGGYSATTQVPVGATVGTHTVTVTGPSMGIVPRKNWLVRIFHRAIAAGEDDTLSSATFTVTAPPVTPPAETPVADTNTAPANTNTPSSNSATKNTTPPPANSNPVTAEPVAPTNSTVTPEPTAQTQSTNEVKEEEKVCYFPWWLWLVLILITAVNLTLFWLRYWKKKSKQSE